MARVFFFLPVERGLHVGTGAEGDRKKEIALGGGIFSGALSRQKWRQFMANRRNLHRLVVRPPHRLGGHWSWYLCVGHGQRCFDAHYKALAHIWAHEPVQPGSTE